MFKTHKKWHHLIFKKTGHTYISVSEKKLAPSNSTGLFSDFYLMLLFEKWRMFDKLFGLTICLPTLSIFFVLMMTQCSLTDLLWGILHALTNINADWKIPVLGTSTFLWETPHVFPHGDIRMARRFWFVIQFHTLLPVPLTQPITLLQPISRLIIWWFLSFTVAPCTVNAFRLFTWQTMWSVASCQKCAVNHNFVHAFTFD